VSLDFGESAQRWLNEQDPRALRIAREIIKRMEDLREVRARDEHERVFRSHSDGIIQGLTLALSYLGGRPGDISITGARGYLNHVEVADQYVAEAKAKAQP
jgi:hypothetical protein